MKRLLIVGLALSLGACATLQKDLSIISQTTVSPTAVKVGINSYDALEATATGYLTFCKANRALPICASYVAARKEILPAVSSGRIARNNMEIFVQQNPGQLGPSGLYNSVMAAISTFQGIISKYSITGVHP